MVHSVYVYKSIWIYVYEGIYIKWEKNLIFLVFWTNSCTWTTISNKIYTDVEYLNIILWVNYSEEAQYV